MLYPLKPQVREHLARGDSTTVDCHMEYIHSQVDCDTGWFMFQAVVGFFGAFRMSTLDRKNCEYAVAKSGHSCQSDIACVLVNLMTGKDRSRGASGVLCAFYRSCSTMRQLL